MCKLNVYLAGSLCKAKRCLFLFVCDYLFEHRQNQNSVKILRLIQSKTVSTFLTLVQIKPVSTFLLYDRSRHSITYEEKQSEHKTKEYISKYLEVYKCLSGYAYRQFYAWLHVVTMFVIHAYFDSVFCDIISDARRLRIQSKLTNVWIQWNFVWFQTTCSMNKIWKVNIFMHPDMTNQYYSETNDEKPESWFEIIRLVFSLTIEKKTVIERLTFFIRCRSCGELGHNKPSNIFIHGMKRLIAYFENVLPLIINYFSM